MTSDGREDALTSCLPVLRCRRVVRDARQRRTHVNDDQVSALLGEPQRVCPALAARGSGYQRGLTRDPITHRCHHLLPPVPGPGSLFKVSSQSVYGHELASPPRPRNRLKRARSAERFGSWPGD